MRLDPNRQCLVGGIPFIADRVPLVCIAIRETASRWSIMYSDATMRTFDYLMPEGRYFGSILPPGCEWMESVPFDRFWSGFVTQRGICQPFSRGSIFKYGISSSLYAFIEGKMGLTMVDCCGASCGTPVLQSRLEKEFCMRMGWDKNQLEWMNESNVWLVARMSYKANMFCGDRHTRMLDRGEMPS